jgi:5-methylcytosine-specific restriction endonuclease McrA
MADPFPKRKQLARPHRRAKRHVATRAEWARIVAEKQGPCRVCCDPGHNGSLFGRIQLHHLVPRAQLGDDVPDNIAPLCPECHLRVTARQGIALRALAATLTEAEREYVAGRLGPGGLERLFGVGR